MLMHKIALTHQQTGRFDLIAQSPDATVASTLRDTTPATAVWFPPLSTDVGSAVRDALPHDVDDLASAVRCDGLAGNEESVVERSGERVTSPNDPTALCELGRISACSGPRPNLRRRTAGRGRLHPRSGW
jgi:hypothetical protein